MKLTDDGLKECVPLKSLKRLVLDGSDLSDKGMREVGRLQSLHNLDIRERT